MAAAATALRAALALTILVAIAGCRDDADPDRALLADHVTTTGKVSEVDCADRGAVYYVFPAGGRFYWAKAPGGVLDCDRARVGDPVLVWYAPLDPTTSTLLRPHGADDRTKHRTLPGGDWVVLASGWIVAVSLVAAAWLARRTSRR